MLFLSVWLAFNGTDSHSFQVYKKCSDLHAWDDETSNDERPPDKLNIVYFVSEKNGYMETTFEPLVEELCSTHHRMDRTIVFCRTYQNCSNLDLFFDQLWGRNLQTLLVCLTTLVSGWWTRLRPVTFQR